MKFATSIKTLGLMAAASLSLMAGASQADAGYYGNHQGNPWLSGGPRQEAQRHGEFNARRDQLDQRQDQQLERIMNGLESGRLTQREAVTLLREHQAIASLARQYQADGHLGPFELRDLDQRLDLARQHIRFEKRDDERRHYGAGYYR